MNTESLGSFGALLRHFRERAGLTQEVLAEHAGLTPGAIGALERGERRQPYPQTVRALADALGVDAEEHARLVRLASANKRAGSPKLPLDVPAIVQTLKQVRDDRPHPAVLPAAPNLLIGREDEHAALVRALTNPACRLVTVLGPGGVGKTRLALAVATDLSSSFAGGAAWVPLASVSSADQVAGAIANALQEPLRGAEPPVGQLLATLSERQILLVMDNMEHVLEATDVLTSILEHAPATRILVTSRERLRISGEWAVELRGLAHPADALARSAENAPAIRLFEERARQVDHAFAVTLANRSAVARICRMLDGMPLGIELAAAWIGTVSLEEMVTEVARNLDFLQIANRDAPSRHRSLRAVFDHSWNLLGEEERQVFVRLAVFRGGCRRAAAEVVAGASLQVLAALADKSLVRRTLDPAGTPRFDLHELLRQYALAQLQQDPDAESGTRDRHCIYYARQLAERADALLSDRMYTAWTEIAADMDNIRAAWGRAVQQRDYLTLVQMGQSMYMICEVRGLFEEGVTWFREAATALRGMLAANAAASTHSAELVWSLGQILSLYGRCAAQYGRYGEARDVLQEAYELLEQRGDLLLGAGTLTGLGYTSWVLGAYAEARAWFTQCIGLARAHGNAFALAVSESTLALVALAQGADDARRLAQAGLDDWRSLGQPHGLAQALWSMSSVLLAEGALAGAAEAAQEELRQAAGVQDSWASAIALLQLGMIALTRGELAEARYLVQESVSIFAELGEPWSRGRALVTLGWIAYAEGHLDEARRYFEQALAIARAMQLDPVALNAQYGLAVLMRDDAPAAALALIDLISLHPATEQTTRARAGALRLTLITPERGEIGSVHDEAAQPRIPMTGETLSPREVDVLRLLMEGRSNRAIADELIVAVGTVKRHINGIFGKLNVQSRLEAVARARDLNLV